MDDWLKHADLDSAMAQAFSNLHLYEKKLALMIVTRLCRGQIAFGPFDENHRHWGMEAAEEGGDGALYSARDIDFAALDAYLKAAILSIKKVAW